MDSQQTAAETQPVYIREDHPWLDVPDGNLDEDIRFSLDELRFA